MYKAYEPPTPETIEEWVATRPGYKDNTIWKARSHGEMPKCLAHELIFCTPCSMACIRLSPETGAEPIRPGLILK